MPLPSTNALPFAVSAVFAGAICPNAIELAQITAVAAIAAMVLDIMAVAFPLCCCDASVTNNKPRNSNLFPQWRCDAAESHAETLPSPRCKHSRQGFRWVVRHTQGVLGTIMRRRLEVFVPIVLLSILVQSFAPIAAFRMVAFAASDPVLAASICHDSAASTEPQTPPANTQHDHGYCCVLCAAGYGAASVDPPPVIFVSLQRLYQRVSWLEAADAMAILRVGSDPQARAPPQLA